MSATLGGADDYLKRLHQHFVDQFLEEIVGTFDEDPYRRKMKYEEVPLSDRKIAKLKTAEALLNEHGAQIEEGPKYTRTKKTWLETKEEFYARLATLPEHRVDWVRQQLAEGKKPAKMAYFYDEDVHKAIFGDGPVTFRIHY